MAYNLYPAVDETYSFPPEVRTALAQSAEFRNAVVPMTTAQRNTLTGAALWEGRVIANTTEDRLEQCTLPGPVWKAYVTKDLLGGCSVQGSASISGPNVSTIVPVSSFFGSADPSYSIVGGALMFTFPGLYQLSYNIRLTDSGGVTRASLTGSVPYDYPYSTPNGVKAEVIDQPILSGYKTFMGFLAASLGPTGLDFANVIVPAAFTPTLATMRIIVTRLSF